MLFVPAHGLYQLAAYLWDAELFHQLPMPNHKSFSKEYAIWRNTDYVPPTLFAEYPEPVNQHNAKITSPVAHNIEAERRGVSIKNESLL